MALNERGHARNAAGFRELVIICNGLSSSYNPPQQELSISALTSQSNKIDQLIDQLNTALQYEKNIINERQLSFKDLNKQVSRIINALIFFGVPVNVLEDAKSLSFKLVGKRIGKLKTNEDGFPIKTISTSQMSYDMRLENYDKLLKLVAAQQNYIPNETDMKIESLLLHAQNLRTLNQNIITANNNVSNARILRNKALYTDSNNASEVVKKIKSYIKYVFGSNSPEYKQITRISFNKLRV